MAKVNVGIEIKGVQLFDSKFETGAKKAAKVAIDKVFLKSTKHALGQPKEGGLFFALKLIVALDKAARTVKGSCTWEASVIENGQRKMFPSMKQASPATATVPDVNPAKVEQIDVDEAVGNSVEAEVTGILKKVPG